MIQKRTLLTASYQALLFITQVAPNQFYLTAFLNLSVHKIVNLREEHNGLARKYKTTCPYD